MSESVEIDHKKNALLLLRCGTPLLWTPLWVEKSLYVSPRCQPVPMNRRNEPRSSWRQLPTARAQLHDREDKNEPGISLALLPVVTMELAIPALLAPREQTHIAPFRPTDLDGTVRTESNQESGEIKANPGSNFASIFSFLFPASSSEEREKNGEQQELSDFSHSEQGNTPLPHNQEETSASLLTPALTYDVSSALLLLAPTVLSEHANINSEQSETADNKGLVSQGQSDSSFPGGARVSTYTEEGVPPSGYGGERDSLSAIVALGPIFRASSPKARPNITADIPSSPLDEQRESAPSPSDGQGEGAHFLLTISQPEQETHTLPIEELTHQENLPEPSATPSPFSTVPLSISSAIGRPGSLSLTNSERSAGGLLRSGDANASALPDLQAAPPFTQSAATVHDEHLRSHQSSVENHDQRFTIVPSGQFPSSVTEHDLTAKSQILNNGEPSLALERANPGVQEERPRTEVASATPQRSDFLLPTANGQPNKVATSIEQKGITATVHAFSEIEVEEPPVIYTGSRESEKNVSIGEKIQSALPHRDSQTLNSEDFATRRLRVLNPVSSQLPGMDGVRPHGEGFAGTLSPPTFAQQLVTPGATVVKRVASEIAAHLDQGKKKVVIELEPQELGRIQIDLVLEGEKVQVRIVTEATDVSTLIQTHLSELKQALQHHSLELGMISVDVNTQSGERGDQPQGFQRQLGRHDEEGSRAYNTQTEEDEQAERRRISAAHQRNGVSVWA